MKFVLGTFLVLTFSAFYVHAASTSILQNNQLIQNYANLFLNQAQSVINNISDPSLQSLAQGLFNQVQHLLNNGNSKNLNDTLNTVITVINVITTIGSIFGKRDLESEKIVEQLGQLGGAFQDLLNNLLNTGISQIIATLGQSDLSSLFGGLLAGIGKRGLTIQDLFQLAQQYGQQALQQYQSQITALFNSLSPAVQNLVNQTLNQILNGNSKDLISDLLGSVDLGSLLGGIDIGSTLTTIAINLLPSLISIIGKRDLESEKIVEQLGQLGGAFQELLNNLVNAGVSTLFGAVSQNELLANLLGGLLGGKRQKPTLGF